VVASGGNVTVTEVRGSLEDYLQHLAAQGPVFNVRTRVPAVPPKLTIELVPRPLWGQSIAQLHKLQWDKLRKPCYRAAGYRCEICGGKGPAHPVEAHEVWEYTDDGIRGVQRLVRLIALCPDCHGTKHLGFTRTVKGEAEYGRLLDHMVAVNGWGRGDNAQRMLDDVLRAAEAEWERRNRIEWTQDLATFLQA